MKDRIRVIKGANYVYVASWKHPIYHHRPKLHNSVCIHLVPVPLPLLLFHANWPQILIREERNLMTQWRFKLHDYLSCQICHVSTNAHVILQLIIDLKWEKALQFIINSFVEFFSITFILVVLWICYACAEMNTLISYSQFKINGIKITFLLLQFSYF